MSPEVRCCVEEGSTAALVWHFRKESGSTRITWHMTGGTTPPGPHQRESCSWEERILAVTILLNWYVMMELVWKCFNYSTQLSELQKTNKIEYFLWWHWSLACSIELETHVVITGGNYHPEKVTEYTMDGFVMDLPDLKHPRRSHGCGTYVNEDLYQA